MIAMTGHTKIIRGKKNVVYEHSQSAWNMPVPKQMFQTQEKNIRVGIYKRARLLWIQASFELYMLRLFTNLLALESSMIGRKGTGCLKSLSLRRFVTRVCTPTTSEL
ncbi:hypothetical protein PMIN02_003131 [Paraphaeosphaeria minitans]